MVRVKPFAAIKPAKGIEKEVSAPPYDVLNSEEAKKMATEKSLLHITKPEIDFDPIGDEHSKESYDKAVENFKMFKEKGWLVKDEEEHYYVYSQSMNGMTQYGIVGCCHWEDYMENKIKKHELTRKEKEDDRMIHINIQNANIEPVFFFHQNNNELSHIILNQIINKPDFDVITEDNVRHAVWTIYNKETNKRISEIYDSIPSFYVADGHHRTAAAARVGQERMKANPQHKGNEEYNYFMAVIFPQNHLRVYDYNRVVFDLNGLTDEQFVKLLEESFIIEKKGREEYKPNKLHNFSMYFRDYWYSLTAKEGKYDDNDPIGVLDVTILSNLVFDEILDLGDLRTSKRIDFVGGIRGLGELKRRVDSKEAQVAFALYPVSMQQIVNISDTGNIMPPKTTWFEPKLRSGFLIHDF